MYKKIIKGVCIFLISIFLTTCVSCTKNKEVEISFPEKIQELKSYKLEATLQTIFQNGTKECDVIVYFEAPSNYRVELVNKQVNEKQIMIRNDKGVFVILPSINKTFKINSEWPNSSSQPYLLHSISKDILKSENISKNVENGKTTIELDTKLFSNSDNVKEKIVFDNKSKMPTDIYIYRNNNELFNYVKINKIEQNIETQKELFIVDNTITSSRLDFISSSVEFDRSITYPVYCPYNTKLTQEVLSGGASDKSAVMKFSGDYSFTLLEAYVISSEALKTEYFTGDIYIMNGSFGLVANNTLTFYCAGMEYTLASNTTSFEELLMVAESLGTSDIK